MAEENEERSGANQEGSEKSEKLGNTIDADEARKVIATPGAAQVLDIRPQDEFGEAHIAGSNNVDADDLDSAVEDLDEDSPVIVVCADGKRSAEVAERLRDEGYEAASIDGGMGSWTSDKLPTQPAEDQEFEGPRRPGPLGQ